MNRDTELARELKANTIFRIDENLRMVKKSLDMISEEDLWQRPNAASNSIGNILVHLKGNITQYILSGLDGREDLRQRDEEFARTGGDTKSVLIDKLDSLLREVKSIINGLTEEQLIRHYAVQGFDLSGAGILLHVVEHFSYHTGQIAYWVKQLKNKGLNFYEGIDLNKKNKN